MDKKAYSENWTDVIRPAILLRDGYKCQDCGVRHKKYIHRTGANQWHYIEPDEYNEYNTHKMRVYRVFLQVAHKDCNKDNNDYSNLRTVCLWCHLKMDKAYKQLLRMSKKKDNPFYGLISASQSLCSIY